jgi:hypothetical protein
MFQNQNHHNRSAFALEAIRPSPTSTSLDLNQSVAKCEIPGGGAQALERVHPLPRLWLIYLCNDAAERWLRGIALEGKSRLLCGSDRGAERAAVMYGLIVMPR